MERAAKKENFSSWVTKTILGAVIIAFVGGIGFLIKTVYDLDKDFKQLSSVYQQEKKELSDDIIKLKKTLVVIVGKFNLDPAILKDIVSYHDIRGVFDTEAIYQQDGNSTPQHALAHSQMIASKDSKTLEYLATASQEMTNLQFQKESLTKMRLVGVAQTESNKKFALIEKAPEQGFVVTVGSIIGQGYGKVIDISNEKVTVRISKPGEEEDIEIKR